ncbi:MAG: hypothetical protein AAF943_15155 [Pseudomonadota bacterium]
MKPIVTALLALAASATAASATTYRYMSTTNGVDATYLYDTRTDVFQLDFEVLDSVGVDGAWWVINDGPNPAKTGATQLAILYTDLMNVWAYEYTGGYRRSDPGASGTLLQYYGGVVSSSASGVGTTTYGLTLDLTDLNGASTAAMTTDPAQWKGMFFNQTLGTWLHPTIGAFNGCSAGDNTPTQLTCFDGSNWIGWDESNRTTTAVPLPGAFSLAAAPLAALGFGAWRRRRQNARAA